MFRKIRFLIFLLIIILFLFLISRYYFSDINKKNSYRSFNNIEKKIDLYSKKLPILEDNTRDIIEYTERSDTKKKKKFNFWKLLDNNE